jgi:hypothetical protein
VQDLREEGGTPLLDFEKIDHKNATIYGNIDFLTTPWTRKKLKFNLKKITGQWQTFKEQKSIKFVLVQMLVIYHYYC